MALYFLPVTWVVRGAWTTSFSEFMEELRHFQKLYGGRPQFFLGWDICRSVFLCVCTRAPSQRTRYLTVPGSCISAPDSMPMVWFTVLFMVGITARGIVCRWEGTLEGIVMYPTPLNGTCTGQASLSLVMVFVLSRGNWVDGGLQATQLCPWRRQPGTS